MSQTAANPETDAPPAPPTPRYPLLWAVVFAVIPIGLLAWPMLSGKWLVGTLSDQGTAGYAFRDWSARQWITTGHFPMWDAMLMGGIPYVGGTHGDLFYWTSFLRLLLPADTVTNVGFVIHYIAAGIFTYLLLRSFGLSWLAAIVGGLGYELAGLVISYPAPGHDGKLFVTTLLPLALLSLHLAIRKRRYWGFALLALTVGLALLSPHFQMTYYLLIAAGLFGLYETVGSGPEGPQGAQRFAFIGIALAAVLVGFGMAWAEILPFIHYLPFSPRATGYYGFQGSTSYAIPFSHIPEFFIAGFTGTTFQDTYWASNPLKLHSEYLGLPILALAAYGIGAREHRRMAWWLGGIGLLFLLIALGSATPFYQVWWRVMPYVKQTRAPGMAIYVTTLMLAAFAAMGVDRLLAGQGRRFEMICVVAGGIVALLGLSGALGAIAESMAQGIGQAVARERQLDVLAAAQQYMDMARANGPAIRLSGLVGGLLLAAVGGLLMARRTGRLPAMAFAVLLPALVGADLWRNALPFWTYQAPAHEGLYRKDAIIEYLQRQPLPYRVLELTQTPYEVYGGSVLMDFSIPQVLGMHAFQLNAYNELMGGKNEWRYLLTSRHIWDADAVNYLLLPAGTDVVSLGNQVPAFANLAADYDTALTAVANNGKRAVLYRRRTPLPWARLVPGAVKAPDEQAALLIANPRQPEFLDQLVLLAPEAPIQPPRLTALPAPLAAQVKVESWAPGRMSLSIEPAAPQPAYVVISENYYPDWRVTVDGKAVTPVRGNVTQIVVPVPAGARRVELHVQADDFQAGKKVTFASMGLIALGFLLPAILRRARRG